MAKPLFFISLGVLTITVAAYGAYVLLSRPRASPQGTFAPGDLNEDPLLATTGTGNDDSLFPPGGANTSATAVHPDTWPGQPDQDGDLLPDAVEDLYRTEKNNPDTDGDGHTDAEEIKNGYDPLRAGNVRLDSDRDVLLENEEFQWRTDPFAPDTDGDGFPDGAEVRQGFDPATKGDGRGSDALPARRVRAAEQAAESLRPNSRSTNYTEGLAGIFLGNRPLREANKIPVSPERVQQLLDSARLDTTLPEVRVSEFTIAATNTATDVQTYLATLDAISPTAITDTTRLSNALAAAFSGMTESLAGVRVIWQQYEQTLLATPTPASAVEYHRLFVATVRFAIRRFQMIEQTAANDPARAYLATRELQDALAANLPRLQTFRDDLSRLTVKG